MPKQATKNRPAERCQFTGLSRASLYNLAVPCQANQWTPPVQSRLLKQKGAKRGVRLINLASLLKHIKHLPVQ